MCMSWVGQAVKDRTITLIMYGALLVAAATVTAMVVLGMTGLIGGNG